MGLGPQCWTCRSRRVRCTSEMPECRKCVDRGVACLGFGQKRPVRWKQDIVSTSFRVGSGSNMKRETESLSPTSLVESVVMEKTAEVGEKVANVPRQAKLRATTNSPQDEKAVTMMPKIIDQVDINVPRSIELSSEMRIIVHAMDYRQFPLYQPQQYNANKHI